MGQKMRKAVLWGVLLPFIGAIPIVIIATNEEWIVENYGISTFNTLMPVCIVLCIVLSMLPFIGMFSKLFSSGGYRMFWGRGKAASAILLSGKEAMATVVGLGEHSGGGTLTINDQPVLNLVMSIKQGSLQPYEVKMDILIPRSQVPQFQPGAIFPVKVDMEDPNKVVLDMKRLGDIKKPRIGGKGWSAMDRELTEKSGKEAMVDIVSIEDTGKSEDFKPVIKMTYDVHKIGETVYRLEKELAVQSEMIEKMRTVVGKSFKAKVHPYDKEKVSIDIVF
jgi:hypothetical protein